MKTDDQFRKSKIFRKVRVNSCSHLDKGRPTDLTPYSHAQTDSKETFASLVSSADCKHSKNDMDRTTRWLRSEVLEKLRETETETSPDLSGIAPATVPNIDTAPNKRHGKEVYF